MSRWMFALVGGASIVFVMFISGCGESDSSISRSAFVRQAETACVESREKTTAELQAAITKARKVSDGAQFEANVLTPILVDGVKSQVEAIRELGVPSGDEQQVTAILDAYQAWVDGARRNPGRTAAANDVYDEARQLASVYGLKGCAKGPFEA